MSENTEPPNNLGEDVAERSSFANPADPDVSKPADEITDTVNLNSTDTERETETNGDLVAPLPDVSNGEVLDEEIRVGSPFAVDPTTPAANRPIEVFYDVGPIRYTAMGAVAASVMVMVFALAAAWWFPSGGALIAALGCVLSIFGMYSAFRLTSVGLLAIHLLLFVVSYGRSIG